MIYVHRLLLMYQDESRPVVVRLWYCDIGRRGNVPNWAVREKLLDRFLVGGKPVPDRVFDVSIFKGGTNEGCAPAPEEAAKENQLPIAVYVLQGMPWRFCHECSRCASEWGKGLSLQCVAEER